MDDEVDIVAFPVSRHPSKLLRKRLESVAIASSGGKHRTYILIDDGKNQLSVQTRGGCHNSVELSSRT